jgi:hypothetical protein
VLASCIDLQSAPFEFGRGQSGLVGIPKHHVVSKLCLCALEKHLGHPYAKCRNSYVVQNLPLEAAVSPAQIGNPHANDPLSLGRARAIASQIFLRKLGGNPPLSKSPMRHLRPRTPLYLFSRVNSVTQPESLHRTYARDGGCRRVPLPPGARRAALRRVPDRPPAHARQPGETPQAATTPTEGCPVARTARPLRDIRAQAAG